MSYKTGFLCLFLALPAAVLSVPTTLQRDLDTIQARDTPSTSDWGINSGIDDDGPHYDSANHEETNGDGTTSSSQTINANIPGGPYLNYHDNHQDHHYVPPPPTIPSPTPIPTPIVVPTSASSVPIVTPILPPPVATPTPSSSSISPPPPPPVISSPAPAPESEEPEEIGGCEAPGPDDEPEEESNGECPCEDRFGTVEAKLESIARQLDELKALQAQMLQK